jgi:hypothetical protein
MDLFALATLPAAADEAGGPPPIKFYELRDNLQTYLHVLNARSGELNALETQHRALRFPPNEGDKRAARARLQVLTSPVGFSPFPSALRAT